MEEKINKLFQIFSEYKNQQLYSLCISQILSIYSEYPACLYHILRKTNKLIYSKASDPRLRLEQRQISAAIIERTYAIYTKRLVRFLEEGEEEIPSNLFHFEGVEEGSEQRQELQEEEVGRVRSYEVLKQKVGLHWEQIDFEYLIADESIILGKDDSYIKSQQSKNGGGSEQEDVEQGKQVELVMERLGISQNLNEANYLRVLDFMLGKIDLNLDMEQEQEEEDSNSAKTPPPSANSLYFNIINPFSVIYQKALYELISYKWEHRHASALILKSLIKQEGFQYIDFKHRIQKSTSDGQLPGLLRHHLGETQPNNQILNVLNRCLIVIAMDRFADYLNDETHMLVRETACNISILILTNYPSLSGHHHDYIAQLKRFLITSRQSHTYEVTQSVLYLIHGLLPIHKEYILGEFQHLLLAIAQDEIVDEILILLCSIWSELIHDHAYSHQAIVLLQHQIGKQDDISYASKAIFHYLTHLLHHSYPFPLADANHWFTLVDKYFFHKIEAVRNAFYTFLQAYTLHIANALKLNPHQLQDITPLLKTYALVLYQHSLIAQTEETFNLLLNSFCQVTLIIRLLSTPTNQGNAILDQILQKMIYVASIIQFKQAENTNPLVAFISHYFTAFNGSAMNAYSIFHLTPSKVTDPLLLNNGQNNLDFQQDRLIRTSLILERWQGIDPKISDARCQLELSQRYLIWLLGDCKSNRNMNLTNKEVLELLEEFSGINVVGELFQLIDDEIICQLLVINEVLEPYSKSETNAENLEIIRRFLGMQRKIIESDNKGRRELYGELLKMFKELGNIDYALNEKEIRQLQGGCVQAIGCVMRFNKLSQDLIMNMSGIYSLLQIRKSKNVPFEPSDKVLEMLVNRVKYDRFNVFQDIASEVIAWMYPHLGNTQKVLSDLYGSKTSNAAKVIYLFESGKELKRRDYGRKRLLAFLLCTQHASQIVGYLQSLSFNQTVLQMELFEEAGSGQSITVSESQVGQSVWMAKMFIRVFSYHLGTSTPTPLLGQYLVTLFEYFSKLLAMQFQFEQAGIQLESMPFHGYSVTLPQGGTHLAQFSSILTHILKLQLQCAHDQNSYLHLEAIIGTVLRLIKHDVQPVYQFLIATLAHSISLFAAISPLLILPVIKKLTSQPPANQLFGSLVPMLLVSPAHSLHLTTLAAKYHKGATFIDQFGKMTQIHYPITVLKDPSLLRDYQLDGIRWLGFLINHNLNAALCDDMGLGKTLQVLTVMATQIAKYPNSCSLIVAPNTVVDHWQAEIKKYIKPNIMKSSVLQNHQSSNVLLVSYSQLLKKPQEITEKQYLFLILDEAHILKNNRNKSSQMIRTIKAKHKIILSGTPVQNHLLELWSLFDILFPNYLGDEEHFKKHFSKAFHTNLFSLNNEEFLFDEQQTQTLRQLHKKVLPFIMRRTKQDVLPQLPQKIIEDYKCPLVPPLQSKLYEIFERNSFSEDFQVKLEQLQGNQKNKLCESIFKLLHLLKQVLDHPFLIRQTYKEEKPRKKVKMEKDVEAIVNQQVNEIFATVPDPQNYKHSGKMIALKDILQQLGFANQDKHELFVGNHNKVLIFSRFRNALKMIAEELLRTEFPELQYLILDGSVPQNQRYPLVTKFNEDPEIKVLLLTTQVGGLGLNLSSANIVVMFDHDYNPVNDQQAMDRAHRIGQKQVVQVFRLIVTNTLEEKIMGIQRFKQAISRAIVNTDNASLHKMEKTDLLSLLENQEGAKKDTRRKKDKDDETAIGPYARILGQLQLDLLEQLDFDKEY